MNDKSTNGFKIRLDDSVADHDDVEKTNSRKPKPAAVSQARKPSRSIGWLPFLIVALIIIGMMFGYFDIRKRLLSVHSFGSMETQHLSEDLESKFSNLSIKLSSLEESVGSLSEGQTALTGSFSSLKDDLESATKSISAVKSSKADKKSTNDSIEKTRKELSSLTESVKKNIADTAVMSAKMNATLTELKTLSANTSEKFDTLKALIEALDTEKASKTKIVTEIDHVENVIKDSQKQNEAALSDINKSLNRIVSRINALESNAGVQPSGGRTETSPPSNSAGSSSSTLAPGELIERDISQ